MKYVLVEEYFGNDVTRLRTCTFSEYIKCDVNNNTTWLGMFDTLEELQDLLSNYSEWIDDKKWYNPYFSSIEDLILFSENNFEILVDSE